MDSVSGLGRVLTGFVRDAGRLVSAGIAAVLVCAFVQTVAGCAGNQFPLMETTFFQVNQVTPGKLTWTAASTADAAIDGAAPAAVAPQIAIQNLTGPAIFVEAVLVFKASSAGPIAGYAVKKQIAGFGRPEGPRTGEVVTNLIIDLASGVGGDLKIVDDMRPSTVGHASQTLPPNRAVAFDAVVLWQNTFGQSNFRPGTFEPGCFCYPDTGSLPALRMAGSEITPTTHRTTVHWNVEYVVGSSGGS